MDYRALAEAARVQYFWKLLGLPECAADFHLLDQREAEWIRYALRTTEVAEAPSEPTVHERAIVHAIHYWLEDQRKFFSQKLPAQDRWSSILLRLSGGLFAVAMGVASVVLWMSMTGRSEGEFIAGLAYDTVLELGYSILLILAGAITFYRERQGHSENARNYGRMSLLMTRAETLVSRHAGAPDLALRLMRDIGIEALDENSEWLLAHRERPAGPILA